MGMSTRIPGSKLVLLASSWSVILEAVLHEELRQPLEKAQQLSVKSTNIYQGEDKMNLEKIVKLLRLLQEFSGDDIWDIKIFSDGDWVISDDNDDVVLSGNAEDFRGEIADYVVDQLD